MQVIYDPVVDVLRILLNDHPIEESDEEKPDMIFDYDKMGQIVGIEILNASKQLDNPRSLQYQIAA
jgi:uncharacterized protein YuzE